MSPTPRTSIPHLRRILAGVGLATLLVAVLLGVLRPTVIQPAYRFGVFAALAPAIGAMIFLLVHRCTGGAWGEPLRPFLATGASLAPWAWLLIVPLLFFTHRSTAPVWAYDGIASVVVRAVIYGAVLVGVALALTRSLAAWVGPAGILLLLFSMHLLSDDWLVTLEPDWHSTAFALAWLLGQSVAGLSCAVLVALALGVSPDAPAGVPKNPLGIDWGNLLLTATLLWTYVTFAEFLIIWGGNVPRETSWFLRRTEGGWFIVPVLLALLNFAIPLGLLLVRTRKRSPRSLAITAGLLLLGQLIYVAWLIIPAFPAGHTFIGVIAAALFAIGLLALGARILLAQAVPAPTSP